MIQYAIYDQDGRIIKCDYFEEQPENSTDLMCTTPFVDTRFNPVTNEYFEGASQSELRLANIERTKMKYDQHKANGWNAYQDFRGNIVEEIAEGVLTQTEGILIELDLSVGYDKIQQTGDWMTARYLLQNLTVSQPFIEPYRLSAIEIITNYINYNYDS